MTAKLRWLALREVMAVHHRQIADFGGAAGVRDENVVASAMERPRNLEAYATSVDLAALAASLAYGVARNHGFADGNKRTALASAAVFLRLNGARLRAETSDVVSTFVALASGALDENQLAAWIRERSEPIGSA